jgi:predicted  nucleic acid-binding Zn-ribbon protein
MLTQDGKLIATAATEEQLEPLRQQWQRLHGTLAAEPAPNVLRVERSDLEKKLEDFGHNVESLQQQVEKLTAEIKSLREKLAEQK